MLSGGLTLAQKCLPWRPQLLNLIYDVSLAVEEGPGVLGSQCWTATCLTCNLAQKAGAALRSGSGSSSQQDEPQIGEIRKHLQTVGSRPAGQQASAVTLLLISRSFLQMTCRGPLSWEASEPGVRSTHFQGFLPKIKMGAKLFDIIFPDTKDFFKKMYCV